jgi:pimeloyl-ACP methyl ester carboxylesterase
VIPSDSPGEKPGPLKVILRLLALVYALTCSVAFCLGTSGGGAAYLFLVPAPDREYGPDLTEVPCPVAFRVERISCAVLTVPERPGDPESGSLELMVAVLRAQGWPYHADPVLFLSGGPGGSALSFLYYADQQLAWQPVSRGRDLIFMDLRGTGFSTPSLNCPEVDNTFEEGRSWGGAVADCEERLLAEGIDLTAYNSVAVAADVEALRQNLNIETWNLYGVSYGTRYALTVLREYPGTVRSVILDSVVPLEINTMEVGGFNRVNAFRTVFEDCAADPVCNAAYPDLETTFYDLVIQLEAEPLMADFRYHDDKRSQEIHFGGDWLMDVTFSALYSPQETRLLPRLIYELKEGEAETLAILLDAVITPLNHPIPDDYAEGVFYSVICNEEAVFNRRVMTRENINENVPEELQSVFWEDAYWFFTLCESWSSGEADELETQPVLSDTPALILAGRYDPITPPYYADAAAVSLSHSFLYVFPDQGHGILWESACVLSIARVFLNNPTLEPAHECIDNLSPLNFSPPADESTEEEW